MILLDGKTKVSTRRVRQGLPPLRSSEWQERSPGPLVAERPTHQADGGQRHQRTVRLLAVNGNPVLLRELAKIPEILLCVMGQPQVTRPLRDVLDADHIFPYAPTGKLNLKTIYSVRRVIRQVRPHIVHTFASRSLAHANLATLAMRYAPRIIGYRGVIRSISHWDPGHRLSLLHRRTSAIVCVSNAVRQSLIASGVPPQRCHTLPNPLEIPKVPGQCRVHRAEWNIPPDALVIGTAATMRPVKRIDLLLQAAIECADLPNVYWLLIGPIEDPRVHRLMHDARIRDRVRAFGFRPDARELIGAADLLVMTSEMEGLSRVLLEAMAQQVCPVVSNVGGTAEVVRHGVDGFLFPRGDVAALVRHVRHLHANRSKIIACGISARRRVARLFAPENCARQFVQLYQSLLDAPVGCES